LIRWLFRKVELSLLKKVCPSYDVRGFEADPVVGQNKDDLLEMIQHGAEKIINNSQR
jgi:hypothetical protein